MDSSGSIGSEYFKEKKFIIETVAGLDLSPSGTHAGVITFSDNAEHSIKLKDHTDIKSFTDAVNKIDHMKSITRIDLALKLAEKEFFTKSNGARDVSKKMLVIITDGAQTKKPDSVDPAGLADEFRKKGVNVLVIGVGSGVEKNELDRMAGGADKAYIANSFDDLLAGDFKDNLLGDVCPTPTPTPTPVATPTPTIIPSSPGGMMFDPKILSFNHVMTENIQRLSANTWQSTGMVVAAKLKDTKQKI